MKIFQVNGYTTGSKTTFQGYTKYLHKNYSGSLTLENNNYGNFPDGDCSKLVLEHGQPNASVEKTLGVFHTVPTGAVYYADPLEGIADSLREKVDYVVYDNEPKYPNVDGEVYDNYFREKRVDYGKKFAEIRDYYYRLEMADAKEADRQRKNILAGIDVDKSKEKLDYYNDRIAKSKYQQWQAEECIGFYKKGDWLRGQKEWLEDDIKKVENEIRLNQEELPIREKTLAETSAKKQKENAIHDLLESKEKFYRKTISVNKKLIENNPGNEDIYRKEISDVEDLLRKLTNESNLKTTSLWQMEAKIQECKKFISTFPRRIAEMRKQIKANEVQIEQVKAKLTPIFNELKEFYTKQRIIH